jgi:hypothetical protein
MLELVAKGRTIKEKIIFLGELNVFASDIPYLN